MPNKQLTAAVRLNTTQAERKLANIARAIDRINQAAGKQPNLFRKVDRELSKVNKQTKQVDKNTKLVANTTNRLSSLFAKIANLGSNIRSRVQEWATNQRAVTSATRSTNNVLGSIWNRLKGIAATYLGIMGMRAVIQTSDTITSAQNKFNYLNGGDTTATQETMDKMYNSAQKVRMSYTDMMANVSKSMTLAGDSFQGNIDNAIRFQEIMAEAYAIGGASAAEMSSSMYQMIQALGSGRLQGDELRSVREGAPLAYQKIEEFAQGVYNTEKSLKDLASQGKITSDMVVAAIMDAGNKLDSAFAQTKQTFAQTWEQIKNVAKKAFEPVSNMLRDELNKAVDDGLIDKIENVFTTVSKVLQVILKITINVINWIDANWDWIKNLIVVGLLILAGMWLWQAGVAVASAIKTLLAMSKVQWTILIVIAAILALVYVFYLWKTGAIDTCSAIAWAVIIVAAAVALVAMLFGAWPVAIVAAFVAILGLIFMFLEEVTGYVFACMAMWKNVGLSVANFFVAIWEWLKAVWNNFIAFIVNLGTACGNVLSAVWENIGIWWNNICASMKEAFWSFIASCLEGVSKLAPVIEAVASAFGKEISISTIASNARGKAAEAAASKKEYVDYGAAWDAGMNTRQYQDLGGAWNKGMNTYDTWQDGWLTDAYHEGYAFGGKIKDSINQWGSKYQNKDFSLLDSIGEKLGLDFESLFTDKPLGVSGFDPNEMLKDLESIDGNTGKMADAMELTQEDLEYLRRIADMEWKKEFTTANITVDMSNYNTINGDGDLDGIVTKLTDKLYEELDYMANGVYAY